MKPLPILFALTALPAMAATVDLGASNDTSIWHRDGASGYNDYVAGAEDQFNTYHFDGNLNAYGYLQFDLSGLGSTITINSVTLSITKDDAATSNGLTGSDRNDTLVDGRVDFYGLNSTAGNTPQNWSEASLSFDTTGAEIDSTTIAANAGAPWQNVTSFAGQDTVAGFSVASLTGDDLKTFVQGRADDNGLVTLLVVNPDATTGRGITYHSSEAASNQPVLSIDYTVVPEPSIALLGGLGLLGLIRRRRA